MNKRRISSDAHFQAFPDPKHVKVSDNCGNLLDGIDFMEFDEEITSSEGTTDGQTIDKKQLVDKLLGGIDLDSFDDNDQKDSVLDISTWKRCIVNSCRRDGRSHDLIITGCEDAHNADSGNKQMICRLQHFWSQCKIGEGDIISIVAVWNAKLGSFCVTNTDGLVVVRPDFLVSGTTVVGGLFCMRKAVLQDRFKGIEAGMKIVSD